MPLDPIGMAVGLVQKLLGEAVQRWLTPELPEKLLAATKEWAEKLPSEIRCEPLALFPDLESKGIPAGPALTRLQARFEAHVIPSVEEWTAALKETRQVVADRFAPGDGQPFFEAEVEVVAEAIADLAGKLRSVCIQDDQSFKTTTINRLDVLTEGLAGRAISGIQKLESYWNAIRSIAEHPLAESVFTASRDEEAAAIKKWLSGPAGSFFLRSSGLSDGLDFLAALCARGDNDRLLDGVIVHTIEAWRALAASRQPLLLIGAPTLELSAADSAAAVSAGHLVFLSGPRANFAAGPGESLKRQAYYAVSEALIASGFSESEALKLAKACGGSSSILKRLITRHPETTFPRWNRDEIRLALAPFALVGGWMHIDPDPPQRNPSLPRIGSEPPIDVLVVTELVGCSRDELETYLTRWQTGEEPLFLRFGDSVLVASREDAWHLLGGAISRDQVKRFRDLAILVLEEDNPAFELAPDQRWMANVYGKAHSISGDLRRSIVESLALMSIYPTADGPVGNANSTATVRDVLERTLPRGANWQRWASFGRHLKTIAEADPEFFLGRVEADLASADPELSKLFQDQAPSVFGGALHTDLLWALEGLAWTPDYLRRVAVCLAKLASRDPGGNYGNRPAASLREIFLWWLPHTNASISDRIEALSAVIDAEPTVGWSLLGDLLPSGASGSSHGTHIPRWRPWADGWSRARVSADTPAYAAAIADLAIRSAGTDLRRWCEVLEGMLRLGPATTENVLSTLEHLSQTETSDADARFTIWDKLRSLVAKHGRYPGAKWAFEQPVLNRLAAIRDRLQPDDPVLRHGWLFGFRTELPGFDIVKDHVAHDHALWEARGDALREIIAQAGADGVFRLLRKTDGANIIGWLTGQGALLDAQTAGLPALLEDVDKNRSSFIRAFVGARFNKDSWAFVDQLLVASWPPAQIATFASCLPFGGDTWQWLAQFSADVGTQYWQRVVPLSRQKGIDELREAANSLIHVGRGFTAINLLHAASYDNIALPSSLVAEVLEAAASDPNSEAPEAGGDLHYPVQQMFKKLQEDEGFDRMRLAQLEWKYLPLLDPEFSEVGPKTLLAAIQIVPSFFVELLRAVYRGKNEATREAPLPEQEQRKARHAYRLLEVIRQLPGTREDGTVDWPYLGKWIAEVRAEAAACDRREVVDLTIGGLIARGSNRTPETWPPLELANLMEDIGSDELFSGFISGVINSRGVVVSDPTAGGKLERELVEKFRRLAENARRKNSLKLAAACLVLASHYESDARMEDIRTQRERLGR
jgi:hypothetical protein